MAHEYKEYLEEICKDIDKLAKMTPTPERVRIMHDYLYVKKHLMKHGDCAMSEGERSGNPQGHMADKSAY